eukprot:TRINITY_DN25921_c0_g1_i1.p1 TRINITY_DN25921_c0_g1~~TRINITY_DN25921_c0_g1_i1.p1  ORF type:complete len:168 (+),score=38.13 TRINITY_DN25921_c0_g1_i1:158-661(+)
MAAANGVSKIIAGVDFLISTPAISHIIRHNKAYGGIILTASHNPGGPTQDFGVKYNTENGGPAPESLTNAMFKQTEKITNYKIVEETPKFDASKVGEYKFGHMVIQVIDAAKSYVDLMKSIFDFPALKKFVQRKDFSLVYDAMHGVAEIGRAVQQECRDRSRMPSSA